MGEARTAVAAVDDMLGKGIAAVLNARTDDERNEMYKLNYCRSR